MYDYEVWLKEDSGSHETWCACMGCLLSRVKDRREQRKAKQARIAERAHVRTPLHPRALHIGHELGMLTIGYPHKPEAKRPYCFTCRSFYRAALYLRL